MHLLGVQAIFAKIECDLLRCLAVDAAVIVELAFGHSFFPELIGRLSPRIGVNHLSVGSETG